MKSKQVKKLLNGVVNNFCDSIEDESVKLIVRNKTFITGGCIPSMLMDEWVNDYDFYFVDKESANLVKEYFTRLSEGPQTVSEHAKYYVKLITDNAINLSDKIQLITKFVGTPDDVTKNFDWQHIKSYYDCSKDELVLTEGVYQLIVEKELVYTGSAYPLSSLLRLKKYLKKGWNVSTATMVHIALDVASSFSMREEVRCESKDIDLELNLDDIKYATTQSFKYSVNDVLYHLNGVDPLTIQKELQEKCGTYMPVKEIVEILYR